VETTVARKRLEEMRDDLDRTIAVLQSEGKRQEKKKKREIESR